MIAKPDSRRRYHFGVKQGVLGQDAMKGAAMPIRPIHHGRHAKAMTYSWRLWHAALIQFASVGIEFGKE
jgi:hypothetical protein